MIGFKKQNIKNKNTLKYYILIFLSISQSVYYLYTYIQYVYILI